MMMGRFCSRRMAAAAPETTLAEAAARMAHLGVSTVVVLDIDGRPVGTLTDREIVVRLVARDLMPSETFVVEIMTTPVAPDFEDSFFDGPARGRQRPSRDESILVQGSYETLQGLVALDDALTLVDAELARRSGNAPSMNGTAPRKTESSDGLEGWNEHER